MPRKKTSWVIVLSFMLGMITLPSFSGCKRGPKILKQGQRCRKNSKKAVCAKGLKCYKGTCEDLSGNSAACQYFKSSTQGIKDANPIDLLKKFKGTYDYDSNFILDVSRLAAKMYNWTVTGLPEKSCKHHIMCSLPSLGIGYGWFWTRAAYMSNHKIPSEWGAVVPQKSAVQVMSVEEFKQDSIGDDKNRFPELKIKQMKDHRIGCKAKVKFRVRQKFAGFVTFHFWRQTGCEIVMPEKGKKDEQAKWVCKDKKQLNEPDYTYTVYLYPYDQLTLKQLTSGLKNKKQKETFLTGNPGTYSVEVWAHNPIKPALFDMHKRLDKKLVDKLSQYEDFKYCPDYEGDPFKDGCGCVGFVPNKITITVDPDPFYMPSPNERPECKNTGSKGKK